MTTSLKKTDNGDLQAKLMLRRYFLSKYHQTDKPNVFDVCQGSRVIWDVLESEFPLSGYWGVDKKKKKGRLTIDSSRILAMQGWTQNVIDVDTYGVPWKHWLAILDHVRGPLTVFLTIGRSGRSGSQLSREEIGALNLGVIRDLIGSRHLDRFGMMLGEIAIPVLLAEANRPGLHVEEAKKVLSRISNARYYGLRIIPEKLPQYLDK